MKKLKVLLGLLATSAALYAQSYTATLAWDAPDPVPGVTVTGYKVYVDAAGGTPGEAISARAGGSVRSDFTGPVGFYFIAAANVRVTHLGRWVLTGNSAAHTVRLLDSAQTELGAVTINTAGATVGKFSYAPLATPVTLVAGQAYLVVTSETLGGDSWYDSDQSITEDSTAISGMQRAYINLGASFSDTVAKGFGPSGFMFTPPFPTLPVGNVLTAAVSGLQPGVNYAFTVRAVSAELLESDASNAVVYMKPIPPPLPPGIPEIQVASITFGNFRAGNWSNVTFTWAPLDKVKFAFTTYNLKLVNEKTLAEINYPTPDATFTVASLPRASYRVFVTATNATGTSPMLTYAYISGQSPNSPKNVTLTTP